MIKKVLIHGPILTRTGYGEMARLALKSLLKFPDRFDVYINNITWGIHPSWIIEPELRDLVDSLLYKTASYIKTGGGFDISIQCTIPNEFKRMADYNIGYTAGIEATKVHPKWIVACEQMDKIITISSFSKSVFEETVAEVYNQAGQEFQLKLSKPIDYVSFPVKTLEKIDIDNFEPTTSINFLVVAQDGPRKNVDNTIRWFLDTFQDDPNVGLVLKITYLNSSTMDEYHMRKKIGMICASYPSKKCKLYYISGNLKDEEMNCLYQHPTMYALINLSHGEGYGLPMFEASYNGLPVITCGWSGQLDFLTFDKEKITTKPNGKKKKETIRKTCFAEVDFSIDNVPEECTSNEIYVGESKWCNPNKVSFCNMIKKFVNTRAKYQSKSEELRDHLLKEFTEDKICEKFADLVCSKASYDIDSWLDSMNVEDV